MATVPTGALERELRKLYLQWVGGLPRNAGRVNNYIDEFRGASTKLIEKMGGATARLGVSAGFPAPRELDLSLHVGTIYDDMHKAAIKASIASGLNSVTAARAMFNAGLDSSYKRLVRLARTETVSAYWQNQWNEADGLGLVMLWGAERGPRTCEWCLQRDGLVVTDRSIRDHPNGRCTLIPTLPSMVDYKGSVDSSGSISHDADWDKDYRKRPAQPAKATREPGKTADLVPEEAFVNKLAAKLESGELTVAGLQKAAANATGLGKLNAQTAIARHEASKKAAAAASKPTSVAKAAVSDLSKVSRKVPSGPVLTDTQLAALKPKREYLVATAKKTIEAMQSTPAGKSLAKTMKSFQSGTSSAIPRLRTDIEKYLMGAEVSAGRASSIETLLGAINQSDYGSKPLYRGMMIPGSADDVLARYGVGDSLDLSLASFTSDKKTGIGFASPGGQAGQRISTKNNTGVLIEWVGDSKKALPIENLSPSRVFKEEKEWVSAGKYEVLSTKKVIRDGLPQIVIQIKQVSTW